MAVGLFRTLIRSVVIPSAAVAVPAYGGLLSGKG